MNQFVVFTPIVTYIIIGITVLVSYKAIENGGLKWKLMFNPYQVKHKKEWYRLFSSGLIHADWMHLGFNCLTLYFFGTNVEQEFVSEFGKIRGEVNYILLYVIGIAVSSIYTMAKHQDNPNYNALGASGAVSAVLYSAILINPTSNLYIYFAIPIPAWIFGIIYLFYSNYMAKKQIDNIGHEAHFFGAAFGFIITIFFKPEYFLEFISSILNMF